MTEIKILTLKRCILIITVVLLVGCGASHVLAQTSSSVLYVPLIGITSVPDPLSLPEGPGNVTYQYAVKNFLPEFPLHDVKVVDNNCSPVVFMEGDDNGNNELDYSETWRYACTIKMLETMQTIATATGVANGIMASHDAYAVVVVGSEDPAPLVSIVNITKVAYPLSLPKEGGNITFTYRVNNPGVVPLSNVSVSDNKCANMSGKLGDTNGNNLLDIHEVWVYTCKANLKETTTNTATVVASANGLQAVDNYALTVKVANSVTLSSPGYPDTGEDSGVVVDSSMKIIVWGILSDIFITLIVIFFLIHKTGKRKFKK